MPNLQLDLTGATGQLLQADYGLIQTVYVYNPNTSVVYLKLHASETVVSSGTPTLEFAVPPEQLVPIDVNDGYSGISVRQGTGTGTDATAPAASVTGFVQVA